MRQLSLIALTLSSSSPSFAFINPLPDIISLVPSVVKESNNPLHFKEHWAITSSYLNSLDAKPKLIGDFMNTEQPKINSVVFGTEYVA